MGDGMFLKVGQGRLFPLSIWNKLEKMTGLDLVLETEPSITNKVKVGAELTFTTTSQSAVFPKSTGFTYGYSAL